jgi:tetratricopeptide (TPR) repeat protein
MKRTGYLAFTLLLILSLGVPGFSQQPQAKTQAEYQGYMAVYNEQAPPKKAELAEKFLAENKDSDFVPNAYQMLVGAYARSQNWAKVMEAADRAAALPKVDDKLKSFAYQNAMTAAQQTNNFEKIVEYANKSLAINPQDLPALMALATTVPERLPPDEAAKKAALEKGKDYATKALEGTEKLFSQPKPANVTDEQWAQAKAEYNGQLHGALAWIFFNERNYPKAIEEYDTTLKLQPKDAISHYRLGLAYQFIASDASKDLVAAVTAENSAKSGRADQAQLDELVAKRSAIEENVRVNMDKAINELATAVAIGGVVAQPARDALEKLYKTKNNDSLAGLDQLIAQKKTAVQ